MKGRIVLTGIIGLFFVFSVRAQNENDFGKNIHFGLKAGVNSSNVYDEQGNDFVADAKLGYVAGAFITIPMGKFLGIQPEFLFITKGFKATQRYLDNIYGFKRTTSHFDIPVQLQIKPLDMITIVAGPNFSFLLAREDEFSDESSSTYTLREEFANDNIRKNTVGFLGGLDLNFNHWLVGGRAGWDLQTNRGDGTSFSPRYKNTWLQIAAGYRF
ncbi:MAG TPA: porin family protein [Flavobacteriales bacterium]|nr:porin family protein [Flavobacteriales bacterium]